jgi:hypothetical protein
LTPSVELAERIAIATGVDPDAIRNDTTPRYINDHQPYTAESWKDWKNQNKTRELGEDVSREEDVDHAAAAGALICYLLEAASNRNRRGAVIHSLHRWFKSAVKSFDLEKELERVCKANKSPAHFGTRGLFYTSPQGVIRKLGWKHSYPIQKRKPTPGFGLDRTKAAFERQLRADSAGKRDEVAQPVTPAQSKTTRARRPRSKARGNS